MLVVRERCRGPPRGQGGARALSRVERSKEQRVRSLSATHANAQIHATRQAYSVLRSLLPRQTKVSAKRQPNTSGPCSKRAGSYFALATQGPSSPRAARASWRPRWSKRCKR